MDTLLIVAVAAVALLAVYFLFLRKKDEAPAIEDGKAPKALGKDSTGTRPKEPEKKDLASAAKATKPAEKTPSRTEKEPPKPKSEKTGDAEKAPAVASSRGEPAGAEPAASAPSGPAERKSAAAPTPKRARDVAGLRKGLEKSRGTDGFFGRLRSLFTGKKEIDPQIVEQLEEVLLTSDVGVKTSAALLERIKDRLSRSELKDDEAVWAELRAEATRLLDIGGGALAFPSKPTVVMVVGVNGAGKTTTIGKLATRLQLQGKKVVLAAGDTFRAAAVQQLQVWGERVGCEVVRGKDGANPGAVIFDAIQRAKEIGADVVLADTAGRLHTKTNLMEELKKVHRTMAKAMEDAPHETLLVLDATNGQNALQQAALFKEALPLTGLVLTKLDGTAKGGVVLGVCAEHQLPVRYIGVGERPEDLRDFEASEFVEALLGASADATSEAA